MSRRNIWLAVQAIGTVVLLVFLFRRFDWARFGDVMRQMSPLFYVGSLAAAASGQMLYAMRWRVIMGGMGLPVTYAEVLQQTLIGFFFSNLMPTAVGGDAAKVYYLGRKAGYVEVGSSVFVDRFLGFFWLAVIGATLAWWVGADTSIMELNRNLLTLFAVGFSAALIVAATLPIDRIIERLAPLRFQGIAAKVSAAAMMASRGALKPAALVSAGVVVAGYAYLVTVIYQQHFLANGLPLVGTAPVMLVIISMAIFVNVPISVNGIGLREQLHVLLFTGMGVPKEVSVSISLLLFAHSLVLSLIGCGLWLKTRPAPAVSPA